MYKKSGEDAWNREKINTLLTIRILKPKSLCMSEGRVGLIFQTCWPSLSYKIGQHFTG